jgi:autotransporter-associated beta strand protein
MGEYTSCATGTLELAGGVMEVTGYLNAPTYMDQSTDAYGRIIFDGGLLRVMMLGHNNMTWPANPDPNEHLKGYIRSGGAIIDVSFTNYVPYLVINWPFVSDVGEGIDGGLEKRGLAQLTLRKPYRATGPVYLRDGTMLVDTACGATPFGTANMRIGSGLMKFAGTDVTVNPASGAPLTYENGSTLSLSSGTHLTLGAAGAAPDSAIARDGHGVLLVMSGTADTALGANASITVNGGLENDPSTGILRQPIFERRQVTGKNPYRARFLKCDANNELVPATTVEFDPSTSTSATVAEITSAAASVSGNVSVGALNVELSPSGKGLTIAQNATLTIGSGNAGSVAPLLLNNVSAGAGINDNAGIAGGGTIDFGEAEGVIVFNSNAGYLLPVALECALSGSGGVTFAAPMQQFAGLGCRGAAEIKRASTYTGGTWIHNMQLSITKEGGLGSGTVHVCGDLDGGSLMIPGNYDSNKFTNALELAGNGPSYPYDNVNPRYYGTLIVRKGGVTFSGGVTLNSDAIIATGTRGGQKAVDFTAPITGPGRLTVRGTSPVRFSAANTYAGGTVITNGVVEVADAGSLGTGPVVIMPGGVLRFINGSPKTISNVITGAGKIEMNGAAVTLTAADGFKGETSGNGSVSGDGGYVKSGDGVASFTGALPYTGATTVEAGTLRLGYAPCDVLPAADAVTFRLDASATDTITETDGRVTSWADADGRDIAFANTVEYAPTRAASALDDKDVVNFDGQPKRGLIATTAIPELRTVFFVTRVASTHPNGFGNMGLLGKAGADFGLRFLNASTIKADSMFLDGVIHVNGTSAMTFVWGAQPYDTAPVPNNKFNLIEAEAAIPVQNVTFSIGDYWATTYKRSYCGDIAEVVAYDRWLSDDERVEVERHLQDKWGLADVAALACTNVLPVSTDLTVVEGATLDLAGGFQEVATLSGAGVVTNTSSGIATLRLASGTSVFTGTFGGDIYLEIAAGATLDLGGGSLTVRRVGGAGQIVNGTLTVTDEIQPGGIGSVGTLTFASAPIVEGAMLVIDGNGNTVDVIAITGDFNLTGLSMRLSNPRSIPGGSHEIVRAGNTLTGTFYATDIPGGTRWRIAYDPSNAILIRNIGMYISFH